MLEVTPFGELRPVVEDLLTCAFEGGSNYWYFDLRVEAAPTRCKDIESWKDELRSQGKFWHIETPLEPGGKLYLNTEDGPAVIDEPRIQAGLRKIAQLYPKKMLAAIRENTDGDIGDAFLQCVCYGKIIYG